MEMHIGLHNETITKSPSIATTSYVGNLVDRAATLVWLIYVKLSGQEFFLG